MPELIVTESSNPWSGSKADTSLEETADSGAAQGPLGEKENSKPRVSAIDAGFGIVPSSALRTVIYRLLLHGQFESLPQNAKLIGTVLEFPEATLKRHSVNCELRCQPRPEDEKQSSDYPALKQKLMTMHSEFSDFDLDVLDALCMLYNANHDGSGKPVTLRISKICEVRGLQKKIVGRNQAGSLRRAGFTKAQKAKVQASIERLSYCYVDAEIGIASGSNQKPSSATRDRLIHIVNVQESKVNGASNSISFRLGKALSESIADDQRQTGLLSLRILQYDPLQQQWEKRLGRYFSWMFRIRASGKKGSAHSFKVGRLIEEVLGAKDLKDGRRDKLIMRLEHCLSQLTTDGIIEQWRYTSAERSVLSNSYYQRTVEVGMPAFIASYYQKIKRRPAKSSKTNAVQRATGGLPRT